MEITRKTDALQSLTKKNRHISNRDFNRDGEIKVRSCNPCGQGSC